MEISVEELDPIAQQPEQNILSEQLDPQNAPPITTIVGQQPMPEWVNQLEQFVSGGSPYDPMKFLREAIVNPSANTPAVFGKTIDEAMRGVMDFMLPTSVPEVGVQALTGAAIGKVMPKVMAASTRAFRNIRPLAKEVAKDSIKAAMITPEALEARAFYHAADASGKTIIVPSQISTAKSSFGFQGAFEDARKALRHLESTVANFKNDRKFIEAKLVQEDINKLQASMEKTWPGFAKAQKGYKKLQDIGAVRDLVNESDPLRSFEIALRDDVVEGPSGLVSMNSKNRGMRKLLPAEAKEARNILERLGPEPGDSLFQQMAKGRAITGGIGGLVGYDRGGYVGAAQGFAAGVVAPEIINWMISNALRHPATRGFLKRTLETKGGLANPNFWRILGGLGERLGMNMFNPPPPPEILAAQQMQQQQASLSTPGQ